VDGAEGALKVREASRVATEGLSVEQLLHGRRSRSTSRDALVCLDGGGPGAERLAAVAGAAEACGVTVPPLPRTSLGEPLSVFPLTAIVQRIALELGEQLGTDVDAFGYDVPGRKEAWTPVRCDAGHAAPTPADRRRTDALSRVLPEDAAAGVLPRARASSRPPRAPRSS
jgi:hypothetical protein